MAAASVFATQQAEELGFVLMPESAEEFCARYWAGKLSYSAEHAVALEQTARELSGVSVGCRLHDRTYAGFTDCSTTARDWRKLKVAVFSLFEFCLLAIATENERTNGHELEEWSKRRRRDEDSSVAISECMVMHRTGYGDELMFADNKLDWPVWRVLFELGVDPAMVGTDG